jgi:hypothetical protein
MTIKYAEITVIVNEEEETIFRPIIRFFGYDNKFNDYDTIIISFDDGSVCDVKDKYINNNKFEFSCKGNEHIFPIYFEMNDKTFFYLNPNVIDNIKKLNFDTIMKDNKKYKKQTSIPTIPSIYNCIFYIYEPSGTLKTTEVFAILKIRSNEVKPRYHIAYDDRYFDNSSVIYLTDFLFKNKV